MSNSFLMAVEDNRVTIAVPKDCQDQFENGIQLKPCEPLQVSQDFNDVFNRIQKNEVFERPESYPPLTKEEFGEILLNSMKELALVMQKEEGIKFFYGEFGDAKSAGIYYPKWHEPWNNGGFFDPDPQLPPDCLYPQLKHNGLYRILQRLSDDYLFLPARFFTKEAFRVHMQSETLKSATYNQEIALFFAKMTVVYLTTGSTYKEILDRDSFLEKYPHTSKMIFVVGLDEIFFLRDMRPDKYQKISDICPTQEKSDQKINEKTSQKMTPEMTQKLQDCLEPIQPYVISAFNTPQEKIDARKQEVQKNNLSYLEFLRHYKENYVVLK